MIEKIGQLVDDPLVRLTLGGNNDFDRFFAHLFENLVLAFGEQLGRVRPRRRMLLTVKVLFTVKMTKDASTMLLFLTTH